MKISFPLTCLGILPYKKTGEKLHLTSITIPNIKHNELLIRVHTVGVNYADIKQAKGAYPPPLGASEILGLECAGVVVAKGDSVKTFDINQRVMSLVAGGAYAEYAIVQQETTLPIPDTLSFIEAAAIPEAYHTIWYNVFIKGGLKAGEIFLVHGGASGVGSAAIQITKTMGATVIATVGSDDKLDACYKLGTDCVINYKKQNFDEIINEFTKSQGVDVILDWVGSAYFEKHMRLLRRNGHLLLINSLSGDEATIKLNLLIGKCLTVMGSLLRPLSLSEKGKITDDIKKFLLPKLEAGLIKPLISQTFPLQEAEDAHRMVEESKHIGKIILTLL
jgi:NADPH:quinone reductase